MYMQLKYSVGVYELPDGGGGERERPVDVLPHQDGRSARVRSRSLAHLGPKGKL